MTASLYVNKNYIKSEVIKPKKDLRCWCHKSPGLHPPFYDKLEVPRDIKDAQIKMTCHEHSVKDFDLQIETAKFELKMYENAEENPTTVEKIEKLEDKILKLYIGKRFNQNARHAYWYFIESENLKNDKV